MMRRLKKFLLVLALLLMAVWLSITPRATFAGDPSGEGVREEIPVDQADDEVGAWAEEKALEEKVDEGLLVDEATVDEATGELKGENLSDAPETIALPAGCAAFVASNYWSNNCWLGRDPRNGRQYDTQGGYVLGAQHIVWCDGSSLGSAGRDGQFGAATKAAVVAYQHRHGLVADGLVGTLTWSSFRNRLVYDGAVGGYQYYKVRGPRGCGRAFAQNPVTKRWLVRDVQADPDRWIPFRVD